jgi:hypothetical protein
MQFEFNISLYYKIKERQEVKLNQAMKNSVKTLIFSLSLISGIALADDAKKAADIKNILPERAPSLESPAPVRKATVSNDQTKYTAEQKASIVDLKLKSLQKSK